MEFKEVKKLITEKLGWSVTDIFYICTDLYMMDYYLVYRNHRVKCLVALDKINQCVSGVWE